MNGDLYMEMDMTKGSPIKVLLRFMLPVVLGNLFQQFYNMADTVIVGRFVGTGALAAVGSTGTVMFLILGIAMGLSSGFSILTSQNYGAGNLKKVRQSVANGMLLGVLICISLTVISSLIITPVLRLMNTPEDIFSDAHTYLMIIFMGLTGSFFYNMAASFLRAIGNSRVPLYFLIFSAGFNIILDLVMVLVFHLGVAGAALATVISQVTAAVLCFIYIFHSVKVLCPQKGEWHLTREETVHQLRLGVPMALQFAITSSGTMVMQTAVNLFGSTAVASYTASCKLMNVLTQGFAALGPTMAAYSGQNYGKGDWDRLRQGIKAAVTIDVVYGLAAGLTAPLLLKPAMHLFFAGGTDIAEMLTWGRTYLFFCAAFFIPLGCIFIFRNSMQGCGYALFPTMGGVVEFVCRFFLAVAAMRFHSYLLACSCDPVTWFVTAIYTAVCWHMIVKHHIEGNTRRARLPFAVKKPLRPRKAAI